MTSQTDLATLQADIQQLRAQFTKLATTVRDVAGNKVGKAREKAEKSAEKVWMETQRHAHQLGQEIEERPIASVLTAFGAGLFVGLLFSARRG